VAEPQELLAGGSLKIIAAIKDPPVIVRILAHLGLPTRAPPRTPAQRVDLFQAAWAVKATGSATEPAMALGLRSRKRLKRRKIGLLKHSNALKSPAKREFFAKRFVSWMTIDASPA
jgi:hypothetical protein